jgi:hypothetical protein
VQPTIKTFKFFFFESLFSYVGPRGNIKNLYDFLQSILCQFNSQVQLETLSVKVIICFPYALHKWKEEHFVWNYAERIPFLVSIICNGKIIKWNWKQSNQKSMHQFKLYLVHLIKLYELFSLLSTGVTYLSDLLVKNKAGAILFLKNSANWMSLLHYF